MADLRHLVRISQGYDLCWPGSVLFWSLGIIFQAHVVAGRSHVLQVVGISSSFSCWLSAGGQSQHLEPASALCHVAFSNALIYMAVYFFKASRDSHSMQYNHSSDYHITFVRSYWLEASHRFYFYSK